MVSEHDNEEYDLSLEFILLVVFVTGTAYKPHLHVISENEIELLTNVLPWTLVKNLLNNILFYY